MFLSKFCHFANKNLYKNKQHPKVQVLILRLLAFSSADLASSSDANCISCSLFL